MPNVPGVSLARCYKNNNGGNRRTTLLECRTEDFEALMKGVRYFFDEHGEPVAVFIDLKQNPEVWEDFQDLMILEKRRNEPRESVEEVKAKLQKKRKNGSKK